MGFCDQTIVLSLLTGVILGSIYIVFRKISLLFVRKKLLCFLLDFTIVIICSVVTFIISLPVDYGYLRFFQVALEIIGFSLVLYSLGFVLKYPKKLKRKQKSDKI